NQHRIGIRLRGRGEIRNVRHDEAEERHTRELRRLRDVGVLRDAQHQPNHGDGEHDDGEKTRYAQLDRQLAEAAFLPADVRRASCQVINPLRGGAEARAEDAELADGLSKPAFETLLDLAAGRGGPSRIDARLLIRLNPMDDVHDHERAQDARGDVRGLHPPEVAPEEDGGEYGYVIDGLSPPADHAVVEAPSRGQSP